MGSPGKALTSRRLVRRVMDSAPVRYAREWREDDLGTHLLAISAQQLLCTAPLAVTLAAVGKRLTGVSFADVLTHVLHLSPTARNEVIAAFAGSPRVGLTALLLNLLFAVGFGIGVAATLQRGLELMWHMPRGPYLPSAIRQVLWALALPVMISAVVLLGRTSHFVGKHVEPAVVIGFVLQIMLVAAFTWWTQHMLLSRRVQWRQLWPATALSTFAVAVVVLVGRELISGQIVPAYRAYGSVGIGIVLSAWVAIASTAGTAGMAIGCFLRSRKRAVEPADVEPLTSTVASDG